MEDRLLASRQRRERTQEYKDTAAKSCYSLIIIVVALVLLRPVMVNQILGRASAYASAGLLDESMRQCDKALLIDGDSSGAWSQSAKIYKARGDRGMAYGAYQRALDADASNRSASFDLGAMYVEDGKYALAIPYFEQVRKLGPEKAGAYGVTRNPCHRAALEMLILCYEKERDVPNMEVAVKEARIFYPNSRVAREHSVLLPEK